jgi:hypothetical protein
MESFRRSFPECVDATTTGASTGSSQPVTLDLDRVRRMSNTYHNLEALRIFVVVALDRCINVNWDA